ncbi:hypothetical protein ATK17_2257 [Branchiibius hedensis]|uniref:Alpha-tubulin suppressor n=1 Tax=Branchiibius hedensis TaxID=672460 RepID=A0A2Y8ZSR5_9MICO|nr:hypothetical protein [Branchiibius hedensis]PWJ26113.1 hypothetical protein ATK17_2257 [Branchiibius hedensis]SSA34925.1 hypothetical protein SAMN04489750_2257 [Branchiibius hedensis]
MTDRRLPAWTVSVPQVDRRTIVRTAAWSAPVLLVGATALPAAASPLSDPNIVNVTGFGTVVRCSTVPAGTVTFTAYIGPNPAPVGSVVTITLPAGLSFVSGAAQTQTVTVGANGLVSVPAFKVTGASGAYSITATFQGVSDTGVGVVTANAGPVYELYRSVGGTNDPATITSAVTGVTNGQAGAISGDQGSTTSGPSNGSNVAILTQTGTVSYWGRSLGGTAAAPLTLQFAGANVTGVKSVSTWTSVNSSNDTAGGVASDGTSVYQMFSSAVGGPTSVTKVAGISGTVLDVQGTDGYGYALTTNGLYYWTDNVAGTPTATLMPGSAGATSFSAYSTRAGSGTSGALTYGGSLLIGGTVRSWSQGFSLSTATNAPTSVTRLIAEPTVTWALTGSGDLYGIGSAVGNTTAWKNFASNVKTFDSWGYNGYTGGVWVTQDGKAIQFFSHGSTTLSTLDYTQYFGGKNVVQVFASDGGYLALTADKQVYAWTGNNDNSGRTTPAATGINNATDLEVWGLHSGNYWGGGFIIAGTDCA